MADDIVERLRQMNRDDMLDQLNGTTASDWQLKREAAEEIERLRAAGDDMAEWLCLDVAHYHECATMHSDWPEVCDCGADKLRRAWQEARRG